MYPAGFCHFAALAPHQLALAAPDGRHWSRGELCREVTRLADGLANLPLGRGATLFATLDNCAELVILALAAQRLQARLLVLPTGLEQEQALWQAQAAEAPLLFTARNDTVYALATETPARAHPWQHLLAATESLRNSANEADPLPAIDAARAEMAALGMEPDSGQVLYCAAALSEFNTLSRALAFLHFGHPLILANPWSAAGMLRSLDQYRATACQLQASHVEQLVDSPITLREAHDLDAIKVLFFDDTSADKQLSQALRNWLGPAPQLCTFAPGNAQAEAIPA